MVAFGACMRIAMVRPIEPIDSVKNVIWSVGVNYIDNYAKAKTMRLVYEVLEIIGRALAWRGCEKTSYVVSKATVVCVFLDCHQLNTVVAQIDNPRQNLVSKFSVLCDTTMHWAHANMSFVNFERPWFLLYAWVLKYEFCLRIEKDSVKKFAIAVLAHVSCPSRVFIRLMVVKLSDLNFVPFAMLDKRRAIWFSFQSNCPNAKLIPLALVLFPVPIVKITELSRLRQLLLTIESAFAAGAHSLYARSPLG